MYFKSAMVAENVQKGKNSYPKKNHSNFAFSKAMHKFNLLCFFISKCPKTPSCLSKKVPLIK